MDLQQFEEVVVGRELKMIHLERQVHELREKIGEPTKSKGRS
jgi:hypothetical protein